MTSYQSTIVSIPCSIFQSFDIEESHDLEGHSRSLEMAQLNRLHRSSYLSSIVTITISCIICEIRQDIGRKLHFFIPRSNPIIEYLWWHPFYTETKTWTWTVNPYSWDSAHL